jgi:two-component system chemotaxis response regulator CheB
MLAYSEMIAEKIRTASRAKLAAHKPGGTDDLEIGAITQFGKTAGHWRLNRRNRGNSPCTPAIAAFKSRYSYYPAYAARFTRSFAERLNKLCQITVKEAEDGERVLRACVYRAWRQAYGAGAQRRELSNQNS